MRSDDSPPGSVDRPYQDAGVESVQRIKLGLESGQLRAEPAVDSQGRLTEISAAPNYRPPSGNRRVRPK